MVVPGDTRARVPRCDSTDTCPRRIRLPGVLIGGEDELPAAAYGEPWSLI